MASATSLCQKIRRNRKVNTVNCLGSQQRRNNTIETTAMAVIKNRTIIKVLSGLLILLVMACCAIEQTSGEYYSSGSSDNNNFYNPVEKIYSANSKYGVNNYHRHGHDNIYNQPPAQGYNHLPQQQYQSQRLYGNNQNGHFYHHYQKSQAGYNQHNNFDHQYSLNNQQYNNDATYGTQQQQQVYGNSQKYKSNYDANNYNTGYGAQSSYEPSNVYSNNNVKKNNYDSYDYEKKNEKIVYIKDAYFGKHYESEEIDPSDLIYPYPYNYDKDDNNYDISNSGEYGANEQQQNNNQPQQTPQPIPQQPPESEPQQFNININQESVGTTETSSAKVCEDKKALNSCSIYYTCADKGVEGVIGKCSESISQKNLVFDHTTQTCKDPEALKECSIENYCANRNDTSSSFVSLGGDCSPIGYNCKDKTSVNCSFSQSVVFNKTDGNCVSKTTVAECNKFTNAVIFQ